MNLPNDPGVYLIVNTRNHKKYVGSSAVSILSRCVSHRDSLRCGIHANDHLQKAWNKYGEESFEFGWLLICAPLICIDREQEFMDLFSVCDSNYGYNIAPTAGSQLGFKHSKETRRRISEIQLGRKQTPEHAANAAAKRLGSKRGEETRARMSKAQKTRSKEIAEQVRIYWTGRPKSPESIAKMRATLTGRKLSSQTKARMSAARLGHETSPETRAKISAALKGRLVSEEMKRRISSTLLGRKLSAETRAKLSKSQKSRRAREKAECLLSITDEE